MADSQNKIDAAAEKAFAEAAEKKTAAAVTAKPAAPAPAAKVAVPAPAPVAAPVKAKAKAPAKGAAKPARKPAITPRLVKKIAADNAATVTAAAAAAPAATPSALTPLAKLKDTIMATAHTATTTDFAAKAKEAAADMQSRAKAAYDKGAEYAAEATEFQKGNLEALVASGKILAAGLQDMGRSYVEEAKAAVETAQADVRKVAAIKTPTEFFQLQGEIVRRNFDAVVATSSKNTEAMLKLVNEAFAPVSSRMSLAAEKFSKAA